MKQQEDGPKWKKMLSRELTAANRFLSWDEATWRSFLRNGRRITSSNHDTVLSLDWPHYCVHATDGCGGDNGWCYTFTGFQSGEAHVNKVGMVDALARRFPALFAERVHKEVTAEVNSGKLDYPNLRYSGSGEVTPHHIDAITKISNLGVHLWGFTRRIDVALKLQRIGAGVLFSVDKTTAPEVVEEVGREGILVAYNSSGVDDAPPEGAFVVFPLHRGGRVREVVDAPALCPKVVHEFFQQRRPEHACQRFCTRCHRP